MSQRILVCGVGSAGERHISNLLALGYEQIAVYRRRGRPFRTLARDFPVYTRLNVALADLAPTVVFVTNPTALHLEVALPAARAGCHLFIEKPVSDTLEGLDELQRTLAKHGRFAMVGYMMRFHPLLQQAKGWLDEGQLGRPLWARATWGEHLPDWHPWEDYRASYAARREQGGGPALTLSHELDTLVWFFGPAVAVTGMMNERGPLETDSTQAVDILLRFARGITANVHLDYWQRPPQRTWELVCTHGRLLFDYYAGTLTRWDGVIGEQPPPEGAIQPHAEVMKVPVGWQRNDLFLDELRYFFACLEEGVPPRPGLATAAESVRIARLVQSTEIEPIS